MIKFDLTIDKSYDDINMVFEQNITGKIVIRLPMQI